jgi:murein DD-endopeptidase MepM/ murein hydrolase activator NlpD
MTSQRGGKSWRKLLSGNFWGLVALCVFLWCLGSQPVYAQSVKDLQNYQQLVDQQRQIIQKQQEQIQQIAKPAQDRLESLRSHIKVTQAQIDDNVRKLAQATAKLKQLESNLQESELALTRKRTATTVRLRYMQRQQIGKWWALLLSSNDLLHFADRRRQLSRIYEGDQELLSKIKKVTDKVETERDAVATQKNDIDLINQKLIYQKGTFEAEAIAQSHIVNRLKSDHRALEQAEDRLAQDSRQITALILAKIQPASGMILSPGTGQMMYPTIGPITSPFGWRMHPILGYEKFHSGIDFGADYGTMVYAADSGTVIFAGWYGGYGNAVIISHGNDITTLYGHNSELYVSEGENVQKGQPISAVGSTGFSTGPHLHFEVRSSGEPIDPAPFL